MDILQSIQFDKPLEDSRIDEYDFEFENTIVDPRRSFDVYKLLYKLFAQENFSPDTIVMHYCTYWKWFVMATWKNLLSISREDFLLLYPKQFLSAIYLSYDVMDDLLFVLYKKSYDDKDVASMYHTIRDTIFSTNFPCIGDISYTMISLAEDIKKISIVQDNIERASLLQSMEQKLFVVDKTFWEYNNKQKTEILLEIIEVISSFLNTENIKEVYENYITSYLDDHSDEGLDEIGQIDDIPITAIAEDSINDSQQITKISHPSYTTIRQQLEQEFSYDDMGMLEPLEDVLHRLSELAVQYSDPRIEELYYFDETVGEFKWNEELLGI